MPFERLVTAHQLHLKEPITKVKFLTEDAEVSCQDTSNWESKVGSRPSYLIEAFLSDRTQHVVVDGESSNTAPVISGVPQGSVLGPILFLAFINDMPDCVKAQCRLFADDSIIYRTVNCEEDAIKLQQDLDALHRWESDWG